MLFSAHAILFLSLGGTPPPCTNCLPPPLPEGPKILDKQGCTSQILLVPREKAITLPNWQLRDIEIDRRPTITLDFVQEKACVIENKLQEREVEQQVVVMESKPVKVTEPCGKCRTEYVPCEVVKTVKVKVYEVVQVPVQVVVSVPVLKAGPEEVISKVQLDKLTVPGIETRYSAVTANNQPKVQVVAPPLPKACPGKGCGHP